jgi:hypothetical protein
MPAPDSVLQLCATFADHRDHFRSGIYNEAQLRKQFLDPLFDALGWDMANSQGLAPQYRDVIDDVHVMREASATSDGIVKLHSEREDAVVPIESAIAKPFLTGQDVSRYDIPFPNHRCVYPYRDDNGRTRILDEATFRTNFPQAYSYLKRHQSYLTEIRRRQKTNPSYWYSCHRSRDMSVFERMRIISPEISKGCNFTIAAAGIYHNTQVYSFVPDEKRNETCFTGLES